MDCYDAPRYWDLAFSDETQIEADFLEEVARTHVTVERGTVLEIGCGGGRQVVEMARRGWTVTALDLTPACVEFTRRRLSRLQLPADILQADMTAFEIRRKNRPVRFDLAHCLVNTFRHLNSDSAALSHLRCVARALKPGGLYVLGFHLLPPDAVELDCERWTIRHRQQRITTTVRVLEFSRRRRLETVRFTLKVTSRRSIKRYSSDHVLRIYRADQFRRLLRSVPEFSLLGVCDFNYDPAEFLALNDDLGDAVFLLQRTDVAGEEAVNSAE